MNTMTYLLAGVFALLVVASAIGWIIARRSQNPEARATIDNLNARIKAWWLMVALFGLAFLIAIVQLSDVLQYVFGKLFGKRKVAPRVSPAKTWEGLVGGGLSASAVGAALWWIAPFTPLQAFGMALGIVIAGFCGGLVLSAVKRSLGAKDWGTMIEGHGGALDRMDSVSFAAPVFFHLANYFFAS